MRTFADIVDIVVNSTKVSFGQVLQVLFLAVAAIFFLATVEFLTGLLNHVSRQFLGMPDELTFVFRSTDEDDIGEVRIRAPGIRSRERRVVVVVVRPKHGVPAPPISARRNAALTARRSSGRRTTTTGAR